MPPVVPSYAISGARGRLTPVQEQIIARVLDDLPNYCTIVTGGANGVDAFAARWAKQSHRAVYTILPADHAQIDPDWAQWCDMYLQMAPGTTYRDRNLKLVQEGMGGLRGFPAFAESAPESKRSGTWQTIRLALRHGEDLQKQFARSRHPFSVVVTVIGRTIR
jgi:hypothetical protein